jgi:uncharacterized protein RhaS with RHS repeats
MGSLLANGVGSAGMAYRRNRFYDGSTGQFNQQDPIGLAGGANSYGFAAGDPVNFSDPFGLCTIPPCPHPRPGMFMGAALNGTAQVVNRVRNHPATETVAMILASAVAPEATAVVGAARGAARLQRMAIRYMSEREALEVEQTGTIPNLNAAREPRKIHYTTDPPLTSATEAQGKYHLGGSKPTHSCSFPLCNVLDDVPPDGTVEPGAHQAATSQPIAGASIPVKLKP